MERLGSRGAIGVFVLASLGALAGCPGEPVTPDGRPKLDCEGEVKYQGTKVEAAVQVMSFGGGKGSVESTALREAPEKIQIYAAAQRRSCDEYNKGAITREEYKQKSDEALRWLMPIASERAKSSDRREKATGEYALAVLSGNTKDAVAPISIEVSLRARAPLPSGEYAPEIVVPPNYPLATGTLGAFEVVSTSTVYLYMFQVTPQKEVNVLFPNKALSTANPLEGGKRARMPGMGADGKLKTFKLDDKSVGLERVYFIASPTPLAALDRSLAAFADGRATAIDADPALADFAALRPGNDGLCAGEKTRELTIVDDPDGAKAKPAPRAGGECVRTRGWVIDDAPEPGKPVSHSLAARSAPGERVIVKFFQFQHVPAADAPAKLDAYNANTPDGAKQRGISIEN